MCSGQGRCVAPVFRVRNESVVDADVQLFAHTGCDISSKRLSLFDSVPDFATANWMCTFRNWFHFIITTTDSLPVSGVIEVRDRLVHHTNRERAQMLSELRVLATLPHTCDRTYTHRRQHVLGRRQSRHSRRFGACAGCRVDENVGKEEQSLDNAILRHAAQQTANRLSAPILS